MSDSQVASLTAREARRGLTPWRWLSMLLAVPVALVVGLWVGAFVAAATFVGVWEEVSGAQ